MSKFLKAMELLSPSSVNRSSETKEEQQNPIEDTSPPQESIPEQKQEHSESEEKEELLTILLDIGNGVEEPITIYTADKAEDVAKSFASRHGMSEKMQEKLRKHIQQTIDQVLVEVALEESERKENIQIEDNKEEKGEVVLERKVLEGSPLNALPVHARLHVQAVSKQRALKYTRDYCIFNKMTVVNAKADNERRARTRPISSNKNSLNFGDRLYQKGMKRLEEHEREVREAKKSREMAEQQKYTFKPEINANSKLLAKDASRDKPEDRLIMVGQAVQEKKEQQKTALDIEDKLKCTFHPELNKE
eukprot:TRINITY_DN10796_c0_g1_i2.p1 TRINITY_DN10796_c0_g1~~TRINITY_DN10796_c0_g1_i2.p1  ORF type:complete len:305 (-),score=104.11 TRINITY_DN10796_c0_g1_i2:2338-3252(-)